MKHFQGSALTSYGERFSPHTGWAARGDPPRRRRFSCLLRIFSEHAGSFQRRGGTGQIVVALFINAARMQAGCASSSSGIPPAAPRQVDSLFSPNWKAVPCFCELAMALRPCPFFVHGAPVLHRALQLAEYALYYKNARLGSAPGEIV